MKPFIFSKTQSKALKPLTAEELDLVADRTVGGMMVGFPPPGTIWRAPTGETGTYYSCGEDCEGIQTDD